MLVWAAPDISQNFSLVKCWKEDTCKAFYFISLTLIYKLLYLKSYLVSNIKVRSLDLQGLDKKITGGLDSIQIKYFRVCKTQCINNQNIRDYCKQLNTFNHKSSGFSLLLQACSFFWFLLPCIALNYHKYVKVIKRVADALNRSHELWRLKQTKKTKA